MIAWNMEGAGNDTFNDSGTDTITDLGADNDVSVVSSKSWHSECY